MKRLLYKSPFSGQGTMKCPQDKPHVSLCKYIRHMHLLKREMVTKERTCSQMCSDVSAEICVLFGMHISAILPQLHCLPCQVGCLGVLPSQF